MPKDKRWRDKARWENRQTPPGKLPTVYLCPACGKQAINVKIFPGGEHARVRCRNCGLAKEMDTRPAFSEIDIYCQFTDIFYSILASKKGKFAGE